MTTRRALVVLVAASFVAVAALLVRDSGSRSAFETAKAAPAPSSDVRSSADPRALPEAERDHVAASPALDAVQRARTVMPASLRIVTDAGAPISGALVTWSPLSHAWLERAIHWPDLDWSALERERRTFVSDSDGNVVVSDLPSVRGAEASVLWITHAGHRATPVVLDFPSSALALPPQVALPTCAPLNVVVRGADGTQARGATIVQLVDLSRDDAYLEREARERAPYVLRAIATADENGAAQLGAFPDKQYDYAELYCQRSEPWQGTTPASIVLDLRPTFRAGGRVELDAGARASDMRVKCTVFRGFDTVVFDRVRVRPDGTWGDLELPLVKCDHYAFSFRGGDLAEEIVTLPPPEAGARLAIDFRPKRGLSIPIRVVDDANAPIEGALASAHWHVDGEWHGLGARTDRDGNATIGNCLPGQLWVRAKADRFIQKTLPEIALTTQPAEPFVVQLDHAGRITGRCSRAGKPVPDFSVLFWSHGGESRGKKVVSGSADGSFVIEESPLGEVQLVATTSDISRGDAERVMVAAGVASEVVFELAEPIVGRGRVIDASTGQCPADARVQIHISDSIRRVIVEPWKSAELVRPDGTFELRGFTPGENTLAITAPGYGRRDVRLIGIAGQELDFGSVGIHRQRSAQIQLVSKTPVDFTQYRASIHGTVFVPEQNVPADGLLRYDHLDVDKYTLTLRSPSGIVRTDDVTVRPGKDTYLEIPVSTTPVTIEVDSSAGGSPGPYRLRVGFMNTSWLAAEHTYAVPDTGRLEIDGMTGEWMMLRLFDANDRCVAMDEVALTPSPPELVRLRARSDGLTFRVMDATKQPVPGVRVVVTTPSNDSGWTENLQTDAGGACSMASIALERVFVLLHHPDRGVELSQLVEVPKNGRGTIELVFAPRCTLRVRLLERDVPVPNVEVSVQDSQRLLWGLGPTFTDHDGVASWGPVGEGSVDLYVLQSGYWWETSKVKVSSASATIPIQVRKTGAVDILLKDGDGNPVPGVAVDFRSVELKEWASTWIQAGNMPWPPNGLTSDANGRIRADGFPAGDYVYRVIAPGNEEDHATTIPVHGTLELEIVVP